MQIDVVGAASPKRPARFRRDVASGLREVVYRLRAPPGSIPRQLPLRLAREGDALDIRTTVAHLDDEGMVWRSLAVQGPTEQVARARAAFEAYAPSHVVEKAVLGAAPGRLLLWYKYRPRTRGGPSHTALAFRLLGRDTVVTDRTRADTLTVRVMARAGPGLTEFMRRLRRTPGADVEVIYVGPVRDVGQARLGRLEQQAVAAAHEAGYYAVPRSACVRDVARRLGVPATTASYRLRRAEAKLVAAHVQGWDDL